MSIYYRTTDQKEIDIIRPLWLQLIEHHRERSRFFKAHFESVRFEDRKQALLNKTGRHPLHINLALENGQTIGYCVTSLTADGKGEIESLLVAKEYRGRGIGDYLVQQADLWLETKQAQRRVIGVGEGNEEVLPFYRRYNFHPLVYQMVRQSGGAPTGRSTDDSRVLAGNLTDLESIQNLWEKLTNYNGAVTPLFKDHFEQRRFRDKKANILEIARQGEIKLELVPSTTPGTPGGYCLSSISAQREGRIESIYLEADLRGQGIGTELLTRALDWMDNRVTRIVLNTAAGNLRAVHWYNSFSFQTRNTLLQQVPQTHCPIPEPVITL